MSKVSTANKFVDLSDYGRPVARFIANSLKNTKFTPVHVTYMFGVSGILAIICIINEYYFLAGFFLILKSILDAADGELSRVKNTPSYTGRYLDSIFDILLNLAFLVTISYVSNESWIYTFFAFIGIQLQGTLYNYYYIILRNNLSGSDTTSRVFEDTVPKAFPGENQKTVNILFSIFNFLYSFFDKTIYQLDKTAVNVKKIPKWFMTALSVYGLGFQLLLISTLLVLNLKVYIIPFFIFYSSLIFVFIGIRKQFIK
ncbi:MAG: CDP-alcohol phosphatidyltransferase family protein [Candidatus Sericytochromatia bacterium]|nr:CDP-alcohol phosphatidyltransferase family protein [Candidatus Sericytochromatia bacterium]